ncbi:MAG: NADPH:quinone reductase, partial [Solirubrobacteraceae bacterium]|nr:NADPH:quinone reductase [Solirubrobacteraceae bacterium]
HASQNAYVAKYELPLTPGAEVAGVLEDGTRVVALTGGAGGYAELAAVPREFVVPIPDGVSDGAALAVLLQGLTAWHLYRTAGRVAAGETVVVVSGAGGVGSLAVQLGRGMGAGRVIATASSEEKRSLTRDLGADVALDTSALTADALREANGGHDVDVVFEMAGGEVFEACFDALAPLGRLVAYGISSREQNQVRTGKLLRTSRAVVGFWLFHVTGRPEMVGPPLEDLFARLAAGEIRVVEGETYPLSGARRAHEDLKARRTSGKLLLDPSR